MSINLISFQVGITGSYAGVVIQYIIPATLIMVGRRAIPEALSNVAFPYKSPFQSIVWPFLVIIWAIISVVLVTFDIINDRAVKTI